MALHTFDHWSASQVETFRSCRRKWWYEKIAGYRRPDSPATIAGKEVHAQLETYQKTFNAAVLGPVALFGRRYIDGRPIFQVELPIGLDKRNGAPPPEKQPPPLLVAHGIPAEGYIDRAYIAKGTVIVEDWKTTGDMRWAKTPDELRANPQMVIYAEAVSRLYAQRFGERPATVDVAHIVLLRDPPYGDRRTVATLRSEELPEKWSDIEEDVKSMKAVALLPTADRVTPSWTACSAFGGCPHKDRCAALRSVAPFTTPLPTSNPSRPFAGLNKEVPMADAPTPTNPLLNRLRRPGQAAAPAAPAATPPASVTVQAPGPTADPFAAGTPDAGSLLARLRQGRPAGTVPTGVLPPDAPNPTADAGVGAAVARQAAASTAPATPAPAVTPEVDLEKSTAQRKPRGYQKKCQSLGWSDAQIERMNPETCRHIIEKSIKAAEHEIHADGSFYMKAEAAAKIPLAASVKVATAPQTRDLNSNEALAEGVRLGWDDATQIQFMADDVFEAVLVGGLTPDKYDLLEDDTGAFIDVVDKAPSSVQAPPEPEPPAAPLRRLRGGSPPAQTPAPAITPEIPAAPPVPERAVESDDTGPARDTLVLFIDCRPAKGYPVEPIALEDYLAPVQRRVAEVSSVTHYSLVPYNGGPALVAGMVSTAPPTGAFVCDSRLPCTNAVLEVLLPYADVVVRGAR